MGKIIRLSLLLGLFFFAFSFVSSVHASETNSPSNYKFYRGTDTKDSSKSARGDTFAVNTAAETGATHGAIRKIKLSEARLKICKLREGQISLRFKNLLSFGVKSHMWLDSLVIRVDNFYNKVLVPAGYSLPNYTALKSDISTKQANVQTALAKAQTDGASFSCDSDDPKTQADTFRTDISNLIAADKEYRTAVRTFVAAVRDLAKKAKADKLSPAPSISPVVSPEATAAPQQ